MYNHLMIDIETLDRHPGGVITSLGAAFFDPHDDYTEDFPDDIPIFYKNISIDSCLRAGLTVEEQTIFWWMGQGEDAIQALNDPKPEKIDKVLWNFSKWFWDQRDVLANMPSAPKDHNDKPIIYIWSHGATFDIPFLTLAFKACNKYVPWNFRFARDTRTLFDLAFNGGEASFEGLGTKHNSLHDALTQTIWVQEAYRKLNIT